MNGNNFFLFIVCLISVFLDFSAAEPFSTSARNSYFCFWTSSISNGQTHYMFLHQTAVGKERSFVLFDSIWNKEHSLVDCITSSSHAAIKSFSSKCWKARDRSFSDIPDGRFNIRMLVQPDGPCAALGQLPDLGVHVRRTRDLESIENKTIYQDNEESSQKLKRSKRAWMIPGTLWCGSGSKASHFSDLGLFEDTDTCCREHDHCEQTIASFEFGYGVFNTNFFTLSHCDCDSKFRHCLHNANDRMSDMVGYGYFNVLKMRCFEFSQRLECAERTWWGMCKYSQMTTFALLKDATDYNSTFPVLEDDKLDLSIHHTVSFGELTVTNDLVMSSEDGNKKQRLAVTVNTAQQSELHGNTEESLKTHTRDSSRIETTDSLKTEKPDSVKTETPDSLKTETPDSLKTETPDLLKTEPPDSLKTETPDSLKTKTPDSLKTETPDSLKTEPPDSLKTETDSLKTETPDSLKTETDSLKTETPDSLKTETRYSPKTETPSSPKTETTDLLKTETKHSLKTKPTASPHIITHSEQKQTTDRSQRHTTDSPMTHTRDSPKTEITDSTKTQIIDSSRTQTTNSLQIKITDSPKTQTTDSPKTDTTDSLKTQTRDLPKTKITDSAKTEATDTTQTQILDSSRTQTTDSSKTEPTDSSNTETTDTTKTQILDSSRTQTTDSPQIKITDSPKTQTTVSPKTHTTDSLKTQTRDLPKTKITDPSKPQTSGSPKMFIHPEIHTRQKGKLDTCESYKDLDSCHYQIPALREKFGLRNAEHTTLYHCNCTARLAKELAEEDEVDKVHFWLLDFVSQSCFFLPQNCTGSESCSASSPNDAPLVERWSDGAAVWRHLAAPGRKAKRLKSRRSKRKDSPIRLHKKCLRMMHSKLQTPRRLEKRSAAAVQ